MTAGKREKTRYTGVYQLVSTERRHDGKADVCWYYTLKDVQGKKVWVKVGWRSEGYSAQVAADARAKAVQAVRDGTPLPRACAQGMTFSEGWTFFDEKWLSIAIKQPEDERGRYSRYIKSVFGSRRLDGITPFDLEDFKGQLLGRGLSPATVRLILSDVRRVYRKLLSGNFIVARIRQAVCACPVWTTPVPAT